LDHNLADCHQGSTMQPDHLGKIGDIDGDGDFDGGDYVLLEETEGNRREPDNGRGNTGCCLILLAPLISLAMITAAWYKL